MKTLLLALLALTMCLSPCSAQTALQAPFYVAATQAYKFPGTNWSESPGDIEQVIAEDAANYIVIAPDGTQFRLPKTLATKVSAEQAAGQLMVQRQKDYLQLLLLVEIAKVVNAQKQQAANNSNAAQQLQMLQQLQSLTSGGQRPTQYNGRPLPRNWIDPKQADANLYRDQQNAELQRLRNEVQQLNQQLRR